MKLIPLTQGKFAQVDDCRYEELNSYKWHACKVKPNSETWYARRKDPNGLLVYMHRQIMGCAEGDGKLIDHEDRNGLNCQEYNMRFCTYSKNNSNKHANNKRKTSRYFGVSVLVKKRKYMSKDGIQSTYTCKMITACISVNKKYIHLGSFKTEEKAALAYNEAAVKHHGEFANLNAIN